MPPSGSPARRRNRSTTAASCSLGEGCVDLRRPLPLPRALRKPLPARSADALQGFRARRRLVADQPADPDGHLRARLLAALEGRAGAALRVVPPGRADRMAVLLVVADDRVAVAARQCGADPEGALSAAAG